MRIKYLYLIPLMFILVMWLSHCTKSSTKSKDDEIPDKTSILVLSNYPGTNEWIDTTFTKYIPGLVFSLRDIESSAPKVDSLLLYDLVFLFEDGVFNPSSAVGDSIYEYVMAGGNLILSTFYWQDRSDGGWGYNWGKLETIDPLYGGSCDYIYDSLGTILEHPLTLGVDSLYTYYRGGTTTLRENATAVAWWADGDIFIAFNTPNGRITAVTTYPGEPFVEYEEVQEDFIQIWANAIYWTAWGKSVSLAKRPLAKAKAASKRIKTTHKLSPGTISSGSGQNNR